MSVIRPACAVVQFINNIFYGKNTGKNLEKLGYYG